METSPLVSLLLFILISAFTNLLLFFLLNLPQFTFSKIFFYPLGKFNLTFRLQILKPVCLPGL